MPTVRDVVARKGRNVVSVAPDFTVHDAARTMMDSRIGCVLVCDGDVGIVGILTERDVLRLVAAGQREPATTLVSEVMTRELITVTCPTSLDECSAVMTAHRVRHVPVIDGDGLKGIVTPGDLLAFQVDEQQTLIKDFEHYLYSLR